jgi:hypothetical protein
MYRPFYYCSAHKLLTKRGKRKRYRQKRIPMAISVHSRVLNGRAITGTTMPIANGLGDKRLLVTALLF